MKAATNTQPAFVACLLISIHAAREGGDSSSVVCLIDSCISIHAAREGGDFFRVNGVVVKTISIHAAREGGDPS